MRASTRIRLYFLGNGIAYATATALWILGSHLQIVPLPISILYSYVIYRSEEDE